jgi:endonuclease/exonuclease/phosphatase family metal-dependent hydrolase
VRLLVYNIRYATGTGPAFHLPLPGAGYLRSNRKVLSGITEFIRAERPDVVGLIEVDTGSIRTGMLNQADHIAGELGHYSTYQTKYGADSLNQFMPIVRKQGNAFLSAPTVHGERFHYFDTGIKRLIIELELSDVCVFFNTFWGTHEIYLFMRAAGLRSANTAGLPSFPARIPRIELDFVLVSEGIEVTDFRIPDVRLSDHRPLVCDFEVQRGATARPASAA